MGVRSRRKCYAPPDLPNLLSWGYLNPVHSCRWLENACLTNHEVIWLLGELRPDHCSISRFREAYARRIKV